MKYGRDVYLCAVKLRKSPENQKDKLSLHILKQEKENSNLLVHNNANRIV